MNRLKSLVLFLLANCLVYAGHYNDITVKGANSLGKQAVLHYSNLDISKNITPADLRKAIVDLHKSGLFEDIKIYSAGKSLIISVVEKPVLSKINFDGTDHMPRDQFIKALEAQGLSVGKVIDPKFVYQIKPMLEQTLARMGYGKALVQVKTKKRGKSVVLDIKVKEGPAELIKDVNFVGNSSVSERSLLSVMDLAPRLWSFISGNNKFSEVSMQQDLQSIGKYYQSKGFVQARAQLLRKYKVKGGVALTIKINEGKKYVMSDSSLVGFVKHDYSRVLRNLEKGEPYDINKIELTRKELEHALGAMGYAFAKVSFMPKLLDDNKVAVVFTATLGKKFKVGRINFSGQSYTQDEVLRREMLQMESSQYNYSLIRESERSLRNLDFIKEVACAPKQHGDLVDLNCQVQEMPSANFIASIGYSPQSGITYKADVKQKNLAGSGKKLLVSLEKSDVQTSGQISMTQPYIFGTEYSNTWSIDAVKLKNLNRRAAKYQTNHVGLYNDFSMPIRDRTLFAIGLGLQNISIVSYDDTIDYVDNFVQAHGKKFNVLDVHLSLIHNSYNKTPFPNSGVSRRLSITGTIPYKDATLRYYKVDFKNSAYWSLPHGLTLNWLMQFGYGRGFGGDIYPFFKNYFAGGEGSVRGYDTNSLGPRDNAGNAMGANVLLSSSINLYLPQMLGDDIRYGLFIDAGNVFQDSVDMHELRVSSGAVVQWRTPLAPMAFALGFPLVKKTGDKLQSFSVSLATDF